MKKTIALFLAVVCLFSLFGCAKKEEEPKNLTAVDVLQDMFLSAGVELFEQVQVLNEEEALRQLNVRAMMEDVEELTSLDGYVGGVYIRPMMSPATSAVTVLQFESDKDFDTYLPALRGMKYHEICILPKEEEIFMGRNGNFICYISDGKNGAKLLSAFENAKLPSPSDKITDSAFQELKEGKAKEILFFPDASYYIDPPQFDEQWNELPGKFGIEKDKILRMVATNSAPDWSSDTPYAYQHYWIICADTATAEQVQKAVTAQLNEENSYFEAKGRTYTIQILDSTTLSVQYEK